MVKKSNILIATLPDSGTSSIKLIPAFATRRIALRFGCRQGQAADMKSSHHYLPVDDQLFHDGFYVTGIGRARIAPQSDYPSPVHPSFYHFDWKQGRIFAEFGINLITAGQGTFETKETGPMRLKAGDCLLLFPGVWHRYRPDRKTGWTEKWLHFNGEFVHKLWSRGLLSPQRPLSSPSNFRQIEAGQDSLLRQVELNPGFNSLYYALLVSRLLSLILNSAINATSGVKPLLETGAQKDSIVSSARNYIWTQGRSELSAGEIARHLGVNRRTLERRMRTGLGRSVLEEITRCRFNRAERLLRETDLPIKAVVYLAGFGTSEKMRQTFLKCAGENPRSYRLAKRIEAPPGRAKTARP
jgi:AraC-like DNA-binding protein